MNDTERTIISVLNEGLIEFERIIPKNDSAFKLKHKSAHNKNAIVLFCLSPGYRMFIYNEKAGKVLDKIDYDSMENTWSVFNSLSLENKTKHND